jgi:hypothetical protein
MSTEITLEDDREWFSARPDRILRLRHATEGDPIGLGPDHVVFVFCSVNGIRMRPGFTMLPDMRDALMAEDTDEVLAPYFAVFLDEMVEEEPGPGSLSGPPARRLRKLFQIARKHGRLAKMPSNEVLDAP